MKISKEEINFIEKTTRTAKILGIDEIIVEPGRVRAIDEDHSIFILQQGLPTYSFNSIGINRTDTFLSRLEIAKSQDNLNVDVQFDDDNVFTREVTMKSKKIRVNYRCANPTTIKAPKSLKQQNFAYSFNLNKEDVEILQKGCAAMNAEDVTIIHNNKQISCEMVDINNDVFSQVVSNECYVEDDAAEKFAFRYPVKRFMSLMKHRDSEKIEITEKGFLCVQIEGLNVYILPKQ